MRSPDAISGRYFFLYSSDAPYSIAFAVKTADEKYGAHSRDRPISSRTIHCSDKPKPWPPYSSGIAIAVKPNSVLTLRHCSFSQPASVAIKRRTSVVGDFSSKKRLRNDLNSSCSSEKLNFILIILPCGNTIKLWAHQLFLGFKLFEWRFYLFNILYQIWWEILVKSSRYYVAHIRKSIFYQMCQLIVPACNAK